MKKHILKFAGVIRYFKKFLHNGSKFKVNPIKRVKMFFLGFYPDASVFYNFKKFNRKDFLTDYKMCTRAVTINTGYTELMNNKLVFSEFMKNRVRVPQTYGYISKGKIFTIDFDSYQKDNLVFLKQTILTNGPVMLKLFDGGSGFGIFKLSFENGQFYKNNQIITDFELSEVLGKLDNYMISQIVDQADYSKKIFPLTCNTVKFVTMIDPKTNTPFVARAFHRFGTNKSIPVDNLGKGSCLANIDVQTGVLQKTYTIQNGNLVWINNHPDTNEKIEGAAVDGFIEVRDSILKLHAEINYIKYIAWDVVIQNDGYVLLEGNANTDLAGMQPFEPLLLDNRVREFYRFHKVI